MKKYNGVHFYININNINEIVSADERTNEDLARTFHAINTFVVIIERFANELSNVQIEKFSTSRLHFFINNENNEDKSKMLSNALEIMVFGKKLAEQINNFNKYKGLKDLTIGCGMDYGTYSLLNIKINDSEELTSIGDPANKAAKIQSLCSNGQVLISGNSYDLLPIDLKKLFFKNTDLIKELKTKYTDLEIYKSEIATIYDSLSVSHQNRVDKFIEEAKKLAENVRLDEIQFPEPKSLFDFSSLSYKNSYFLKNSAILYADIRGFTKLVENLNETEIKVKIDNISSLMIAEVQKNEGVHVQFQGDRESAIFNKFANEERDFVVRALLTAMKMLDLVDKIDKSIAIGIGCSIGKTYATRIGIRNYKCNVIMGNSVKKADRAEDEAAGINPKENASEIAITNEMYQYICKNKDENVKSLCRIFSQICVNETIYYTTSMKFSEFQSSLFGITLEENSSKQKKNGGLQNWGKS